jgi:hypothetical protein
MPGTSDSTCVLCGTALEHVRYFPRQLITADDMRAEQEFFLNKMRRHNRFLHGWGVVCGCQVVPLPTAKNPWQVQVCPGYAVSPQGDEIVIAQCVTFDLQLGMQPCDPCTVAWPCPPQPVWSPGSEQRTVYLAVRYLECASRPVRVHPAGCGCDELDCEYSRIRETFELKMLWGLPASHTDAKKADAAWAAVALKQIREASDLGFPVPPCPMCTDDPWIVLATLRLPAVQQNAATNPSPPALTAQDIKYLDRRVLYSTTALQVMIEAGL